MWLFVILFLALFGLDLLLYLALRPQIARWPYTPKMRFVRFFLWTSVYMVVVLLLALLFRFHVARYEWLALYYYAFSLFVIFLSVKIIFAVFLIARQVFCLLLYVLGRQYPPIIYWMASAILASVFCVGILVWGMFWGRFHYQVEVLEAEFDHLPEAFDGYTIVQISDLHLGSWLWVENRLNRAIQMTNEQQGDLIVFTGDLVNNYAEEIPPFESLLQQLEAPDGVYAVLGNHDYGRYYRWKNPADSLENLRQIVRGFARSGFALLRNQAVFIRRGDDSIRLVGTENGSNLPFPQIAFLPPETPADTLPVATTNPSHQDASIFDRYFHVLLTHDPFFWDRHVAGLNIPLTLAGHSHGFQVSVRVRGRYWNPTSKYYPFTHGMYQRNGQLLYVNRGLGWLGFAGRISAFPEITRIILRKKR